MSAEKKIEFDYLNEQGECHPVLCQNCIHEIVLTFVDKYNHHLHQTDSLLIKLEGPAQLVKSTKVKPIVPITKLKKETLYQPEGSVILTGSSSIQAAYKLGTKIPMQSEKGASWSVL